MPVLFCNFVELVIYILAFLILRNYIYKWFGLQNITIIAAETYINNNFA